MLADRSLGPAGCRLIRRGRCILIRPRTRHIRSIQQCAAERELEILLSALMASLTLMKRFVELRIVRLNCEPWQWTCGRCQCKLDGIGCAAPSGIKDNRLYCAANGVPSTIRPISNSFLITCSGVKRDSYV